MVMPRLSDHHVQEEGSPHLAPKPLPPLSHLTLTDTDNNQVDTT